MEETEKAYEPVIGKPEGIRPIYLDRRIILKLTLKKNKISECAPHLDRIQWWSIVNVITGFGFAKGLGVS
jgi:hypothetical protein